MARHDREDPHSLEEQLAWLDAIKESSEEPSGPLTGVPGESTAASPYPKDPWGMVPDEQPAPGTPMFRAAGDPANGGRPGDPAGAEAATAAVPPHPPAPSPPSPPPGSAVTVEVDPELARRLENWARTAERGTEGGAFSAPSTAPSNAPATAPSEPPSRATPPAGPAAPERSGPAGGAFGERQGPAGDAFGERRGSTGNGAFGQPAAAAGGAFGAPPPALDESSRTAGSGAFGERPGSFGDGTGAFGERPGGAGGAPGERPAGAFGEQASPSGEAVTDPGRRGPAGTGALGAFGGERIPPSGTATGHDGAGATGGGAFGGERVPPGGETSTGAGTTGSSGPFGASGAFGGPPDAPRAFGERPGTGLAARPPAGGDDRRVGEDTDSFDFSALRGKGRSAAPPGPPSHPSAPSIPSVPSTPFGGRPESDPAAGGERPRFDAFGSGLNTDDLVVPRGEHAPPEPPAGEAAREAAWPGTGTDDRPAAAGPATGPPTGPVTRPEAPAEAAGPAATERPPFVRPSFEWPSTERPSAERSATERPSAERSSTDRPSTERPSTEQRSSFEWPAPGRSTAEPPAFGAPAAGWSGQSPPEHSASGQSASGQSASGQSAAGQATPGRSEPGESESGQPAAGRSEPAADVWATPPPPAERRPAEHAADGAAPAAEPGAEEREPYRPRRRQPMRPEPPFGAPSGDPSRPAGARPAGGPGVAVRPTADSLDPALLLRGRRDTSATGWRKLVFRASAGLIKPGESPEVRRRRELVTRARTPVATGHHRVAVLSLKGGVGKTTTTVGLGSTLASIRGDRVIAVDANPDRGTLSDKVELETAATVRDLLNERAQIKRYVDIRAFTSQAPSRLEILASDHDPLVSEAFSAADYQAVAQALENFYSIAITDCGTGLLHSAMSGVLGLADQLVLVSSPSIDGARAASATLDWLEAHHYADLVKAATVVLCSVRPRSKSKVDLDKLEAHFAARCRAVIRVPYDPHLEEGAEVDLDRLQPATREAYLLLAASVGDGFGGGPV
ncbi:hypothetical protein Sru01_26350 [Sphaerisporangium rufum]|uniref:CobQ/CobB/MinD/ParA nucleotide binding domain-containing protein n=1 Tax=Sphaerisporangium rufum TaxID=1381558 RepID=A0A919V1A5_9ACTN|nr:AAA family ATPase [Sphaerisporangium rufum]GII77653.1 hypothetical protein Sru01_26350 [Sphaerisporangium rufum]